MNFTTENHGHEKCTNNGPKFSAYLFIISQQDSWHVGSCQFQVREYIDDTEDYVNVRLDHQRNQLFQFQITLGATALSVAAAMSIVGVFGMNIHNTDPFHNPDWLAPTLCSSMFTAFSIFVSIVGYVHWKRLFEK